MQKKDTTTKKVPEISDAKMAGLVQSATQRVFALYGANNVTLTYLAPAQRYINVQAAILQKNIAEGKTDPMTGVRDARNPGKVDFYHHVEMLGPCSIAPTPDAPLPDTNGRGICYLHTKAALLCVTVHKFPKGKK